MWKWIKRIIFTIAMLFLCVWAGSIFLVDDSSVRNAVNIIINIVIIIMAFGSIILYFKSEGEGSGLLTFILLLMGGLMIVSGVLGYSLEFFGLIGLVIALWVHLGDAMFNFLKSLFGGK